jgi:hypothetical protein
MDGPHARPAPSESSVRDRSPRACRPRRPARSDRALPAVARLLRPGIVRNRVRRGVRHQRRARRTTPRSGSRDRPSTSSSARGLGAVRADLQPAPRRRPTRCHDRGARTGCSQRRSTAPTGPRPRVWSDCGRCGIAVALVVLFVAAPWSPTRSGAASTGRPGPLRRARPTNCGPASVRRVDGPR